MICSFCMIFAFLLFSTSAFAQQTFYFTATPNRDEAELVKQFAPLALHFERVLGMKVEYVPVVSYEAAVKAFADNKVQLAWFGGYAALKARHAVPHSMMIAQGAEDTNFKSYFIAHASSGLVPSRTFPKKIAGKTFLFGSPTSTSGRLVPEYWIRKHLHRAPTDVFKTVSFSGDHSSTLDLVQAGVAQVGVLNFTVFDAAQRAGKIDESKVKVIWETPPFPDNAFVIRGDVRRKFGDGFPAQVQKAILDIDDPALLKAFSRSRFIPAKTEQYAFLEEIAVQVEADEKRKAK